MSKDEFEEPSQADTWGGGFFAGMSAEQSRREREKNPITLDEMLMSRQVLRIAASILTGASGALCEPKNVPEAIRVLVRERNEYRARWASLKRTTT